jgi:hypothetical protein
MSKISYGLAESLAYPSEKEGGNFFVQKISTCLSLRRGKGDGGQHTVVLNPGMQRCIHFCRLCIRELYFCALTLENCQRIKLELPIFTCGVMVITAWLATAMQEKWFDFGLNSCGTFVLALAPLLFDSGNTD